MSPRKLSYEDATAIRRLYKSDTQWTQKMLAGIYGVSQVLISKIIAGTIYRTPGARQRYHSTNYIANCLHYDQIRAQSDAICQARAEGATLPALALKYGCSTGMIVRILQRARQS